MLTSQEKERYRRQMMMDGWGEDVQEKLKKTVVFIAGAGGLGSPVSFYLAVAGVGHLRICDFDKPDLSNLNRQILHDHTRLGVNKAHSAKETLARINPDVRVTAIPDKIEAANVDELVGGASLIVDCMDNFPTRFILNESAFRKRIPLVFGSVWGMEGRLSFLNPPATPCLSCLYPEGPPVGLFPVVGATPGVIGTLQALETIKFLTGIGRNLRNELLVWDGTQSEFRKFPIAKDRTCPVCKRLGGSTSA